LASIQKRPNGKWRARYRDQEGREYARHFPRKVDAQDWLDEVTADIVTGRYVDPRAGRIELGAFADRWLAAQTFDALTRETIESRIRVHVKPYLGEVELRQLRPSMIQAWVRGRQVEVAPSYCRLLLTHLSTILAAAVDDRLIATNPCASGSVRAPKVVRGRVSPWTVERVRAVVAGHPDEHRAAPVVGAGCGLRQGEVFGLTVDAVDFLRRTMHVRRQVRLVGGQLVFSPPKGGREREVPLPDWVSVALAEHLRVHPATEVTLPWRDPGRGCPHGSAGIHQPGRRGPHSRLLPAQRLEPRARSRPGRTRPRQRLPRAPPSLRQRAAPTGRVDPRRGRVPGSPRPRLHPADLRAPDA
jgi:integrase